MIYEEKYFSRCNVLTDQISLPSYLYFLRYWAISVCIVIICFPVCDVINFEINLSFLIKSIFYHFKKAFCCQKLSQAREWAFKVNLVFMLSVLLSSYNLLYDFFLICVSSRPDAYDSFKISFLITIEQFWTKYYKTFSRFSTIFIEHK